MNRHRAYWSVMGIEPSTGPGQLAQLRRKHKAQLLEMIADYRPHERSLLMIDGFSQVVELLREIKEEIIDGQ